MYVRPVLSVKLVYCGETVPEDGSRCHLAWRQASALAILCVRWRQLLTPSPLKRSTAPTLRPVVAKRLYGSRCHLVPYGGRPRPRRRRVRWGRSSSQSGAQPLPLFSPCLLWPSGWSDRDATCYGDRPRRRPHCDPPSIK